MIKIAMAYMLVFSLLFCMLEDKGEIELEEVPALEYSYSAMLGIISL